MTWGALLLDSAPPDSSDDSGPVLTKPPSRLGGTAVGDFGGKTCCTFRSGLRSSSEHRPGYSLLPHLYQDAPKIAFPNAGGQIPRSRTTCGSRAGIRQGIQPERAPIGNSFSTQLQSGLRLLGCLCRLAPGINFENCIQFLRANRFA
jgi:hypothetical protein